MRILILFRFLSDFVTTVTFQPNERNGQLKKEILITSFHRRPIEWNDIIEWKNKTLKNNYLLFYCFHHFTSSPKKSDIEIKSMQNTILKIMKIILKSIPVIVCGFFVLFMKLCFFLASKNFPILLHFYFSTNLSKNRDSQRFNFFKECYWPNISANDPGSGSKGVDPVFLLFLQR